jgi:phosphopantothenoylcysteine decarboxylase/phosphopantothenate--cysteine ligase
MKKNILLGLTGSIACSKAETFIDLYSKDYNFKILSTFNGLKYLSKDFLNTHTVYSEWEELLGSPHIELSRWADEFIIYPASANLISKISAGIADDLLTSTILMFSKPIYICPAMHEEMYINDQITTNINNLSKSNYIVGPRYGNLDIGDRGLGRLIEPNELKDRINKVKGKVIVTSGPTTEPIDDVKVITNSSSGKQGRSIAIELTARGYDVIYIHSKMINTIPGIQNISFTNSEDLHKTIVAEINDTLSIFMTAAVSDFTINKSDGKISRSSGKINLELIPNNDVIGSIKSNYPNIQCIAFSAQVDDELNFKKIKSKNVDYLVINNILENEFGSDNNKISIINSEELIYKSDTLDKHDIAEAILTTLEY